MAIDPFSIIAGVGAASKGIAELTKQPVSAQFTTQAEYDKANELYRELDRVRRAKTSAEKAHLAAVGGKQTVERRMLEITPAIKQWEQKTKREEFRKAGVETALERLARRETLGEERIRGGLYARGLRGRGEVLAPLERFRTEIGERRTDIMRGEAGRSLLERQQQEMTALGQQYKQWGTQTELWGAGAGLGLGTLGEFRPGGAFGGPTPAEQSILEQNKMMKEWMIKFK